MFRVSVGRIAERLTEALDDMLIGDFEYVLDGERLYADVDYAQLRAARTTVAASVGVRRATCPGGSAASGSTSFSRPQRRCTAA